MGKKAALTLDDADPRVIAAREAEQRLFDFYGLKAKTHYIALPHLDNTRVRVNDIGSGKPVLIVPGNTGDGFPLAPLIAQLKGMRLFILNRPGGGLSEGIDHRTVDMRQFAVQTITAVIDALGLDSVPIVAHSIGGHFSLWTAMDRPDRVSALTLLGVPGNIISTRPPFVLRLLAVPILNKILFKLVRPKSPENALRGLSFMGHKPEVLNNLPPAMAECYYYFQHLPHYQISSLSLMESRSAKIKPSELRNVRQPVQFLWGNNDPFGSVDVGRQIAAAIPVSEFNALEGAGHLPWLDDPVGCGKLVMDFLERH